jgi:hypothetical protein
MNDLEMIAAPVIYYDWAPIEQYFDCQECDQYLPFIQAGKAVFGVEYDLALGDFCSQANAMNCDFLKKRWELDAWRRSCR